MCCIPYLRYIVHISTKSTQIFVCGCVLVRLCMYLHAQNIANTVQKVCICGDVQTVLTLLISGERACVRVCVCVSVCTCVSACVSLRERERETVCVCACVFKVMPAQCALTYSEPIERYPCVPTHPHQGPYPCF